MNWWCLSKPPPKEAGEVNNVFVSSMQHQRLGVTMAATGHQEIAPNGDRFIVLENGRRYEVEPGSPEFRILEYARYAIRIETREARGIEKSPKNTPTLELLESDQPRYRAGIAVTYQRSISTIVLALLAIPLSLANPRAGRSANLLLALFSMIPSQSAGGQPGWVASGRFPFSPARLPCTC